MKRLTPLLALLAVAMAGCGGDEGPRTVSTSVPTGAGTAPALRGVPRPNQSLSRTIAQIKAATRAKGCGPVKGLLQAIYGSVSDDACKTVKSLLDGFRSPRGKRYGSGTVIDYIDRDGGHKAAVLALDRGGADRIVFIESTAERTIPSLFISAFDTAATEAVKAIAANDCPKFLTLANRKIGPGSAADQQACARLPTLPVAQALKSNPRARPRRMGGNSLYAFYALRLGAGRFFTVVMAQQLPGAGIPADASRLAFVNALPLG